MFFLQFMFCLFLFVFMVGTVCVFLLIRATCVIYYIFSFYFPKYGIWSKSSACLKLLQVKDVDELTSTGCWTYKHNVWCNSNYSWWTKRSDAIKNCNFCSEITIYWGVRGEGPVKEGNKFNFNIWRIDNVDV